jgi:hypothetical protein
VETKNPARKWRDFNELSIKYHIFWRGTIFLPNPTGYKLPPTGTLLTSFTGNHSQRKSIVFISESYIADLN